LLFSQINLQTYFFPLLIAFRNPAGSFFDPDQVDIRNEAEYFFDSVKKRSSSFPKTCSAIYTYITDF